MITNSSKHTHPVSNIEKALLAGEIEHQQEPHSIPEEGRGQAAEPETQTNCFKEYRYDNVYLLKGF